ncbi:MAG: hypothetical protein RL060_613 [Bacteroidota bacterium]
MLQDGLRYLAYVVIFFCTTMIQSKEKKRVPATRSAAEETPKEIQY